MNNWNDVRNYLDEDTPSRIPDGMELIPVVGLTFIPGYPQNMFALHNRTLNSDNISAVIQRRPDNKYDGNACEVHVNGEMVGHLPKEVAARVAPRMDSGIAYKAEVLQVRISPENQQNPGLDIILGEVE